MANLSMGILNAKDNSEGGVNLPMAIAGAVGAALVVGAVYGLIGKFVFEHSVVALLVGGASGMAAMKLGGGRSIVAGIVAAVATLAGVLVGKLIIGSPEGVSFISYHTYMFDIIFCYLGAPAAAFFAAGTDSARALINKLPF